LILVAGMIWFDTGAPTLIMADEAEEEEEFISYEDYEWCTDRLLPMIQETESELTLEISEAFLKDEWNSAIIQEVAASIREAFDEIYAEKDWLLEEQATFPGYSTEDSLQESLNCAAFIAMRERTIWALTESHNIQTSGAKSSYTLVRKLKDINDGLREMNMSFGQVYAGFKAFESNLSGFSE